MGWLQDLGLVIAARPEPPVIAVRPMRADRRSGDPFPRGTRDGAVTEIDGLTIGIAYADSMGARSERTIRCIRMFRWEGGVYIDAWCAMRREERTFRLDRIESVQSYRKAAPLRIDDVFGPYVAILQPEPVPLNRAEVIAVCRDPVRVLLFVAMSDGHLHDAEYEVIRTYAVSKVAEERIHSGDPAGVIAAFVANQVPTRAAALRALGPSMEYGEPRAFVDALFDVMLADGRASDDEMEALRAIVAAIARRERKVR